jgi:hypothetical protein
MAMIRFLRPPTVTTTSSRPVCGHFVQLGPGREVLVWKERAKGTVHRWPVGIMDSYESAR